jgi:hypothetical protein
VRQYGRAAPAIDEDEEEHPVCSCFPGVRDAEKHKTLAAFTPCQARQRKLLAAQISFDVCCSLPGRLDLRTVQPCRDTTTWESTIRHIQPLAVESWISVKIDTEHQEWPQSQTSSGAFSFQDDAGFYLLMDALAASAAALSSLFA